MKNYGDLSIILHKILSLLCYFIFGEYLRSWTSLRKRTLSKMNLISMQVSMF